MFYVVLIVPLPLSDNILLHTEHKISTFVYHSYFIETQNQIRVELFFYTTEETL